MAVVGGLTFTAISAGDDHNCALTPGRAGYCWGQNDEGHVGDGTLTNRARPVRVGG